MKSLKKETLLSEKAFILFVSILFIAGFLFHQWEKTQGMVIMLTDVFLFLINGIAIYLLFRKEASRKLLIWLIGVFIASFFIEYFGVKSGEIFGSYHYGEAMKFQIGHVPIVIALNWSILILASYSIANRYFKRSFEKILAAPAIVTLFDYILEPVAMQLDYWQWDNATIPRQNYIAWFLIAWLFSLILHLFKIKVESPYLRFLLFAQTLFFLLFKFVN